MQLAITMKLEIFIPIRDVILIIDIARTLKATRRFKYLAFVIAILLNINIFPMFAGSKDFCKRGSLYLAKFTSQESSLCVIDVY